MKHYPINLNINGRKCVVIGGGDTAYKKVISLLNAGANVKVVAPRAAAKIHRLDKKGMIRLINRSYRKEDLKGSDIVYAATSNPGTNKQIFHDTRGKHIIMNAADTAVYCDFIVPAVFRKGNIVISVSTDGNAPYVAKFLKKKIARIFTPEYTKLLNTMIRMRRELLTMKKEGIRIDIEKALDKLSIKKLNCYIKNDDKQNMNKYLYNYIHTIRAKVK